jgi:anthranilate phosphoribosyltransferase
MNAKIIKDILSSKESGPRKDTVILNAAAAIIVANLADSFESAMKIAEASISDGKALGCLEKLVEVSNRK